jgi:hypothetical protein
MTIEFDDCVRIAAVYQIRHRIFHYSFFSNIVVSNLNAFPTLTSLLSCRLIFLLSSTRCMSHCFFFSSFFGAKKNGKDIEEEKKKKTKKRKLCALTFPLVSKQHKAYCIHIQRYKTIEDDDDKKKRRILNSATGKETRKTSVDPPSQIVLSCIINRLYLSV